MSLFVKTDIFDDFEFDHKLIFNLLFILLLSLEICNLM